jgi:hypothetical protein
MTNHNGLPSQELLFPDERQERVQAVAEAVSDLMELPARTDIGKPYEPTSEELEAAYRLFEQGQANPAAALRSATPSPMAEKIPLQARPKPQRRPLSVKEQRVADKRVPDIWPYVDKPSDDDEDAE